MFEIAIKQESYQTYILWDREAQSRLEVVPERGGMVTSWRIQGQDILYLDEERFANPELSVRGGIPILFPICGNLPDDIYIYRNQQYILKQHGFARNLPWEVQEQFTEDFAGITLVLESNEETRQVYPFDFELAFTYRIKGNKLVIKQQYINKSAEIMPFSSGLHPYFFTSNKKDLVLEIPANQYQDQNTKEIHPFTGKLNFEQEEIDIAFSPVSKNSGSLKNNRSNWKVSLNYSDLYTALVFWTVKGKKYSCLEPWTALRNALNTGENLINLEPGESCETEVEMVVSYS
ncbi:MAG: aldose epimerase [Spirulinaceae cyanobacterium]